ncbi:MAG: hypothetical protein CMO64_00635 [Verrucomicrobiales bacterium]|nr:hypothetical protein [Verrucomicrobiales bacterium]|tara:strand:- start:2485 stop:2850 length:366 start_codon:yes stop_codon:yes gene_type:complete
MAQPRRKPILLVVIDTDPRQNPRPAEALRMAGGIGVWDQVQVHVCLRGEASWAHAGDVSNLPNGAMYKQFIPMVRESGGRVFIQSTDDSCMAIDADTLMTMNLKDEKLAALATKADYVLRF